MRPFTALPLCLFAAGCLGAAVPAHAAPRRAFVTSVSGPGELGSWPDAGSATGLAAGDAICSARAADAGLLDPASYVALLSDATDDAYCRIHDLGGKRSASCGQATLPAAAGPWERTDEVPFAAAVPDLFPPLHRVYHPLRIDENGNQVHGTTWTATGELGERDGPTCNNWTSGASGVTGRFGSTDATASAWAYADGFCNAPKHLFCLQRGAGDPVPPFASWGRLAFVTSAGGNGNLASWPQAGGASGLAAGDAICRSFARSGSLPQPESFRAWLSTATVDARDRFAFDGPWIRVDRVRIVVDLAGLTDGFLRTSINVTETGSYLDATAVWTGTDASGVAAASHCDGWTSPAATGLGGNVKGADEEWTDGANHTCSSSSLRLYCLQDLPLVFADGFESSDASRWSAAVP